MPRQVFTAGEILTAANMNDLSDQTVMVFADSAARGSAIPTPSEGMVTYLSDTNAVEVYDGAAFGAFGGKLLQVVRATDATLRTTTSGSLVDAGITATITPVSASSTLFVYWYYRQAQSGDTNTTNTARFSITDSGNTGLSGATDVNHVDHITIGVSTSLPLVMVGTVASASTSSRTYKARFMRVSGSGTISIENAQSIGQMIIMEVAG